MTKRFGFTLAEVLITLGIIGVVAAMTIPTLIANTNGAKFRSQFKKTVSTLNQAGLMAQAQYDFDYAGTTGTEIKDSDGKTTGKNACINGASDHPEKAMTFCAIFNGTLTGQTYMGAASNIKRNANGKEENYTWVSPAAGGTLANGLALANTITYTLADGSIVGFNSKASGCELAIGSQLTGEIINKAGNSVVYDKDGKLTGGLGDCTGFIDVNGATLPNKEVSCSDSAKDATKVEAPCTVKNDANHMTDVFPIVFHDATVEPASAAAKYVLTSSK